jgi:enterobactin synthetase component D
MHDNTTTFKRCSLGTHIFELPDAFILPFDESTFDGQEFERHYIRKPISIARSVPKRQAEYFAGRQAALAALREAGSTAIDLPIGPDRAPLWPAGFIGSISHSLGIAAAIALPITTGVNGIGIDIERVISPTQIAAICDAILNKQEYSLFAPLASTKGWPYILTLAFSAKESFYKATSSTVGRFFDFDALCIEECDIINARLKTRIVKTLAPRLEAGQYHSLRWIDLSPNILLTSCAW